MVNTERLVSIGRWAIGEERKRRAGLPSEWDQMHWLSRSPHCGTACCIAGRVVLEDGGVPLFPGYSEFTSAYRAQLPDGTVVDVEDYAEIALGTPRYIDDEQDGEEWDPDAGEYRSTDLFAPDNDIHDVLRIIRTLTGVDLTPELEES